MPRASCSTAARSSGREAVEPRAVARELGSHDLLAARPQRPDDRRQCVRAPADHVPADLLRHDLVGARDLPGRLLVVLGQSFAQRDDVDQRDVGQRPHGRIDVAGHREVHQGERSAVGARRRTLRRSRPPAAPVALTTRSAPASAAGSASRSPCAAFERSARARACSSDRFRIRIGSDAAASQVLHGEGRHLPGSHDDGLAALETAEGLGGEVGAQRHERVGRGAEAGLRPDPPARARGCVEQSREARSRRVLPLGPAQRLANLCVDLRLAQDHRVQTGGDGEQVVGRVLLVVGVQGLGEGLVVHVVGLGEQLLQRQEPAVVAGDVGGDLHAVAGGQDHGLADRPPDPGPGGRSSRGRRR